MSLRDIGYTYSLKYAPLYNSVIKMPYSKYHQSFYYCPSLLFKREFDNITIFDHSTPYPFWNLMFQHNIYGLAFFAYHTAMFQCYPRLTWHTYRPSFSQIHGRKFTEISLMHTRYNKYKTVLVTNSWYKNIASDISLLKIYTTNIRRSNAWKLFFASIALYNDVIAARQAEHDRLFLIPQPDVAWNMGVGSERTPGRIFGELGVIDIADGGHRKTVECRHPMLFPLQAPSDWTLDTILPE